MGSVSFRGPNSSLADTPPKSSVTMPATIGRTRAVDVLEAVRRDLKRTYHVAESESFFNTFFKQEDAFLDEILDFVICQGLYDSNKNAWENYPSYSDDLETKFYPVLLKIFKAISGAALKFAAEENKPKTRVQARWVDRHSNVPKSPDEEAASVRPDIISACLTEEESIKLEAMIRELEEKIKDVEAQLKSQGPQAPNSLQDSKKKLEKEKKDLLNVWWLQANTIVEVKRERFAIKPMTDLIEQLSGYIRQVFREQLDRRFSFGIGICCDRLSVWLYDRSGVLGTAQAIDIHQEPKKLIQVIASIALLPSHKLGWDPTMKLYLPNEPEKLQPSYVHYGTLNVEAMDRYKTHFAISMPGRNADDDDEVFITVSALSAAAAEALSGRATLVWEAVRLSEVTAGEIKKIYVLKQTWRPATSTLSEAQLYEYLGNCHDAHSKKLAEVNDPRGGLDKIPLPNSTYKWDRNTLKMPKIFLSCDVQVEGQVDSTQDSIRNKLEHSTSITPSAQIAGAKRGRDSENPKQRDEHKELAHTHVTNLADLFTTTQPATAVETPRILSRIVMETWGWPIKFFQDRVELLSVIRNMVEGHQFCYYNGILQRDVSLGNGLIVPADSGLTMFHGCLIDLDHAKVSFHYNHPRCDIDSPEFQTRVEELTDVLKIRTRKRNLTIEEAVVRKAVAHFPVDVSLFDISKYVDESIRFHLGGEVKDRNVSLTDLGWDHEVVPPTFQGHRARSGDRTGTVPFMSAEVWDQKSIYSKSSIPALGYDRWCHDAIHDMESFFWVLVYICITRKGPGGERRDELKLTSIPDPATLDLRTVVYSLFDGPESTLIFNKRDLLEDHSAFESFILRHFHPYFAPLRRHVLKWWKLLGHGYNFRAFEYDYIHVYILRMLDEAIKDNSITIEENDHMRQLELERRDKDKNRILHTFCPSSTPSSAASSTGSPPSMPLWDPNSPKQSINVHTSKGYKPGSPESPTRGLPSTVPMLQFHHGSPTPGSASAAPMLQSSPPPKGFKKRKI